MKYSFDLSYLQDLYYLLKNLFLEIHCYWLKSANLTQSLMNLLYLLILPYLSIFLTRLLLRSFNQQKEEEKNLLAIFGLKTVKYADVSIVR